MMQHNALTNEVMQDVTMTLLKSYFVMNLFNLSKLLSKNGMYKVPVLESK